MIEANPETESILLFSGLALRDALVDEILPDFHEKSGLVVRCRFEPTSILVGLIRNGEVPDVLLGVSSAVDELAREEVLQATTTRAIASSGIGIAVAKDRHLDPITTRAEFVDYLLAARSVAYSRSGASGIYFATLLAQLGILDAINTKATILESGFTATAVVDGRADVAIQQLSELASVPGVRVADAFPAELQSLTHFSAAISTASSRTWSSAALIDALVSEPSKRAFERIGLRTDVHPSSPA